MADLNQSLIDAAANGHLDVVKYLVSKEVDITADNNTAVQMASRYGHLDVVKYLSLIHI